MKILIITKKNRITVQVNDGAPIHVDTAANQKGTEGIIIPAWPDVNRDGECLYCVRRGEPCARHGGKKRNSNFRMPSVPKPPKPETGAVLAESDIKDSKTGEFKDPWDCMVCRNASDLCVLHEKMTNAGQVPPRRLIPVPTKIERLEED